MTLKIVVHNLTDAEAVEVLSICSNTIGGFERGTFNAERDPSLEFACIGEGRQSDSFDQ